MSDQREQKIAAFRQNKPISELERKWNKAKGRHSNQFWCQEWLYLAFARAEITYKFLEHIK